jgi:hypothetical protein
MKNLFLSATLLFYSTFIFAQSEFQDYVITTKNDTIKGKIKNLNNMAAEKFSFGGLRKEGIEIEVKAGTLFFERKELKAFYFRNRLHRVISYSHRRKGDKRYFYLCMFIDGKQKFGTIGCDFELTPYMLYDKKYIQVTTNNLTQKIWPEMMECASFADLHKNMTDKNLKNIARKRRYNELTFIIEKYNQLCEN